MNIKNIIKMIILSILPISEVRGALPFAFFNKIPFYFAFPVSILFNFLISIFIFFFLDTLNKYLLRIETYKKIFNKVADNARKKIYEKFSKYEYFGLVIFVGIPLPFTGIWTGALGAWILQLDRKKVFFYLFIGVLISATLVSLILFFGLYSFKAFKIFLGKFS